MRNERTFPEVDRGYLLGVDLGQTHDFTAVSLVHCLERTRELDPSETPEARPREFTTWNPAGRGSQRTRTEKHYQVVALHRFPIGTTYTAIVSDIRERLQRSPLRGKTRLILDRTGVGRPVFDLFKDAAADPVGITFSAGERPNPQDGGWTVPKQDLVGALQAAMGTERMEVSGQIPDWPVLRQEMQDLEVRITPSGHAQFAADWRRANSHDDLLFSLAIALWYGERGESAKLEFIPSTTYFSAFGTSYFVR